ncbi:hypothetical protein OR571_09395 [Psychrobacillus sp. NEAU-3TGS]|uniref:hypothetical protein n=1 Tax=Psychrobacillus sp. NEAU-3TGS TaxID=2995412 RepID=UPI0024975421|nr:hypothetical protein [Psychrobacillus sp. NEAU-3TGS]MDI2587308.1 hypothetical protein [Psychrobacillus sp. NEAU-3TGS]
MTERRLVISIGLAMLLLTIVIFYLFNFTKPHAFPMDDKLLKEMNSFYAEAHADVIQDVVYLDKQHVFVPYISQENNYGLSFWVWKHRKWKVEEIDTTGDLRLWKINSKDSATYHFVWNFPSNDQISYMKLYAIKQRGYHILGDVHHYDPAVQLERKISFSEKTYGSIQLDTEWISVIDEWNKLNEAKQPDLFFQPFQPMYFGWNTFDRSDTIIYPERSTGNSSILNNSVGIENVMLVNESELEYP